MWSTRTRSVVIGGVATALIGGAAVAGGVAAARASGPAGAAAATATPGATDSASGSTGRAGKAAKGSKRAQGDVVAHLKGLQHAQWVVADKGGAFVTHDAIRGTVTSVSPTSITVTAKDGVTQTYEVSGTTKVVLRAAKDAATGSATAPATGSPTPTPTGSATTPATGRAAGGSVADVGTGTTVVVSGTGTSTLSADRVVVPQG